MPCEQFIYALFNNTGYKLIINPQTRLLLDRRSLNTLINLRLPRGKTSYEVPMEFPSDHIITYSILKTTTDLYGRKGLWNQTFIIPFNEIFTYIRKGLTPHIIAPTNHPPQTLPVIDVTP